jgi:hypothetical protein
VSREDCLLATTQRKHKWYVPTRMVQPRLHAHIRDMCKAVVCYTQVPMSGTMLHAVYGKEVKVGVWVPLRGHAATSLVSELVPGYEICFSDDAKQPCAVRRCGSKHTLSIEGGQVSVKGTRYSLTHVMLASAFPEVQPLETVDHIDNEYRNNHVTNLQWMTRRDNSAKAPEAVTKDRVGKPVEAYTLDGDLFFVFPSISRAAQWLHKFLNTKEYDSIHSNIREVCLGKRNKAGPLAWKLRNQSIDDEEWRPVPEYMKWVSNKGRVMDVYGTITTGAPLCRDNRPYMGVGVTGGRHELVHRLVWRAFYGPIPEDMQVHVSHDAPRTPEGRYRNWLEDLKLGYPGENNRRGGAVAVIPQTFVPLEEPKSLPPGAVVRRWGGDVVYEQRSPNAVAMTKSKTFALVHTVYIDKIQLISWYTDESATGDPDTFRFYVNLRSNGGVNSAVAKHLHRLPGLLECFPSSAPSQKVFLDEFVHHYLSGQPRVEGQSVAPFDGFRWDCRAENLELLRSKQFRPFTANCVTPDMANEMGLSSCRLPKYMAFGHERGIPYFRVKLPGGSKEVKKSKIAKSLPLCSKYDEMVAFLIAKFGEETFVTELKDRYIRLADSARRLRDAAASADD